MDSPKRTAIDLFAGAGGLSTGLGMADFDILYANEVSEVYAKSLSYNHPDTLVEIGDIRKIAPSNVRAKLKTKTGQLDLLAGGPPVRDLV